MRTPASVLADLLRSDAARPRLTWYDDAPGPSRGERVELSAHVFANWVAKAGNLLQEEYDARPGCTVRLHLPSHWRAVYWAFATWSTGATLALGDVADAGEPDVMVTDAVDFSPEAGRHAGLVVVTLQALARAYPGPLPAGALDEAAELAGYGDLFTTWAEPDRHQPALIGGGETAYGNLVEERGWPRGSRVAVAGELGPVLRAVLAAWAVDGSVVLTRSPDPSKTAAREAAEGVTVPLL